MLPLVTEEGTLTTPLFVTVTPLGALTISQSRALSFALLGSVYAFMVMLEPEAISMFVYRIETIRKGTRTVTLQVAFLPLAVTTPTVAVPAPTAVTTPFSQRATPVSLLPQVRVVLPFAGVSFTSTERL